MVMRRIIKTLLFLVVFIVWTCRNDSKDIYVDTSYIVLIFKNPPSLHFPIGHGVIAGPHSLLYVDTSGVQVEVGVYLPDTLTIATGGRYYLEIEHYVRGWEKLYYLLQAGDTVTFIYDTMKIPTVYSRLGQQNTFQYNIYAKRRFRGMYRNTSLINIINGRYPLSWFDNIDIDSMKMSVSLRAKQQFVADGLFYDSIFDAGAIDSVYYEHIRHLRRIDSLDIFDGRVKKSELPIDANVAKLSDTLLLQYPSYISAFRRYASEYIRPKYESWLDVLNKIDGDTSLTELQRKIVQYYSITTLYNYFVNLNKYSYNEIQEFAERYLSLTGDTAKYNYVQQKINRKQPIMLTDNLALADLKGGATILDSVIAQNRGKVIYVDFWASWCGPCRAQMPDAQKLRERYRGKDVAFVYLALNDVQERWLEAVREEHLNDACCQNYIITNPKRARFIEEHRITGIPRFMLFDRQGKLVDNDAPRPVNPKIVSAIDDLLK